MPELRASARKKRTEPLKEEWRAYKTTTQPTDDSNYEDSYRIGRDSKMKAVLRATSKHPAFLPDLIELKPVGGSSNGNNGDGGDSGDGDSANGYVEMTMRTANAVMAVIKVDKIDSMQNSVQKRKKYTDDETAVSEASESVTCFTGAEKIFDLELRNSSYKSGDSSFHQNRIWEHKGESIILLLSGLGSFVRDDDFSDALST
uniref:Uncharacterized protein n=1 Tax=Parascaris univalens TaxID=6257 RepID=A0A914ZX94_PARUN